MGCSRAVIRWRWLPDEQVVVRRPEKKTKNNEGDVISNPIYETNEEERLNLHLNVSHDECVIR